MGHLQFSWENKELKISHCDKMKTDPKQCDKCKYRFECFTTREAQDEGLVFVNTLTKLSEVIKKVDRLTERDS
jgi:hypothetical protein